MSGQISGKGRRGGGEMVKNTGQEKVEEREETGGSFSGSNTVDREYQGQTVRGVESGRKSKEEVVSPGGKGLKEKNLKIDVRLKGKYVETDEEERDEVEGKPTMICRDMEDKVKYVDQIQEVINKVREERNQMRLLRVEWGKWKLVWGKRLLSSTRL